MGRRQEYGLDASLASALERAAPTDALQRATVLAGVRQAVLQLSSPPPRIDRYQVERILGSGAFGVVYVAYDPELDRQVAIKVLPPDSKRASDRARREAELAAQINHPNVVTPYASGSLDDGSVWIAMELVRGVDLQTHLRGGALTFDDVLALFLDAAAGLAAIHDVGLVHRDFKPHNVLIGDDGRARVADFGLATTTAEATRTRAGTPAYMAPEQLRGGHASAASDQFAFCLALFEALAGWRPSASARLRLRRPHAVPRWLFPVLRRGLAQVPEDRFESMDALLESLHRARRARSRRLGVASLCLLGATTVGLAVGFGDGAERDCAGEAATIDEAWNAGMQAELPVPPAWAEPALRSATQRLDAYASRYSSMYTQTCKATPTRAVLTQRSCLASARESLTAVSSALREMDTEELYAASRIVGTLVPLDDCASGRRHDEQPDPELAGLLARGELSMLDGDYADARILASSVLEQAHQRDRDHDEVRALLLLGTAEHMVDDGTGAADRLEEALWSATSLGDDAIALKAAVILVHEALVQADVAAARRWEAHATALRPRADIAVELDVELELARGFVDDLSMQESDALEHFERARELALTDGLDTSIPDFAIGRSLRRLGDTEGAIAMQEAAHASRLELLGATHPETLVGAHELGVSHLDAGAYERASELFTQVLSSAEAEPATRARSQVGLARALFGLGHIADADAAARATLQLTAGQRQLSGVELRASMVLADIQAATGDVEGARRRMQAIIDRGPGLTHDSQSRYDRALDALLQLR